jgi:hypothetical protein
MYASVSRKMIYNDNNDSADVKITLPQKHMLILVMNS